jgi:hypothetical protein
MLSATLVDTLTERCADGAWLKPPVPFEPGEILERLKLLEQENSDLQQLVCQLLRENESLRVQLRCRQEKI